MMGGLKTVGLRCRDGDFEIFTGQMRVRMEQFEVREVRVR